MCSITVVATSNIKYKVVFCVLLQGDQTPSGGHNCNCNYNTHERGWKIIIIIIIIYLIYKFKK